MPIHGTSGRCQSCIRTTQEVYLQDAGDVFVSQRCQFLVTGFLHLELRQRHLVVVHHDANVTHLQQNDT